MEKEKIWKVVAGNPNRLLKIGDIELDCYVLENGQRVISGRSMQKSLGLESPAGNRLIQFLSKNDIKPFLQAKIDLENFKPIKYKQPTSGNLTVIANGHDANMLKTVCDIILAYRRSAKNIKESEKAVAEKAEILLSGFASVGIIALIDEVTGYQEKRDKDELQKILAAYIAPQLLPWTKRFPVEFYRELFRLQKWNFNPMSLKKPSYVGKLTNELIYEKLPPGVLEHLKKVNPKNEKGNRSHKHHQFLSEDVGNPHLKEQLQQVMLLMRISANKGEFMRHFNRAFPGHQPQPELPLPEEEEQKD